jgi:hypothetical protein
MQKKKTGTRISGTRIRPEYPGIFQIVLASYLSQIQSYSIRLLAVSVPNIKLSESVSGKTDIYTDTRPVFTLSLAKLAIP